MCYTTVAPDKPVRDQRGRDKKEKKVESVVEVKDRETLVITWAQNATPIHRGFVLGSLKALVNDLGAQMLVINGRYKNATSKWTASQENEQWWAPELKPFLHNQRTKLNKNLVLLGDVNIQPTAQYPLSGLEGFSHGESSILGHPKRELVVIPTPHQRLAKIMWTTGACTVENYTDSGAGKKGEFHHIIGALVVEIVDGKVFHIHDITARKDGAFCFFDKAYHPDGSIKPSGAYKALSVGDLHPPFSDPVVIAATFDDGGLVTRLNPAKIVLQDTLDCYAGNPHHKDEPFIAIAKQKSGMDNMAKEVDFTIDFVLDKVKGRQTYITSSNHDDMLRRWIKTNEWRKDPVNAVFYLETALYMAKNTVMTERGAFTPDPFHHWVNKRKQAHIHCLGMLDSLMVAGFELGLHGDKGPNGARGTIKNMAKIGVKVIDGHGHTPGVEGGHRRNGTSSYLSLEYTGPVSSWMNAHTAIDPMDKAHTHICINGDFWA